MDGLESSHPDYSAKYLYSLVNSGNFREAFNYSKKLERQNVNIFESRLVLGIYYLKYSKLDLAKENFQKAKETKRSVLNDYVTNSLNNWSNLKSSNLSNALIEIKKIDERFENLEDYNFKPNYIEINNLRIHYLDEGPVDGEVICLLHGEPAWSYLFRKMIAVLTEAGYRVIAPDMVGFGKSDKYISTSMYTHQIHVDTMIKLITELDLNNITAHLHDWGGMVG